MAKERKAMLRCNEGHTLFQLAAVFGLPEKLGEAGYNVADRTIAADEVRELYRELKSRSDLFMSDKRLLFGPADNWENETRKDGDEIWKMKDVERQIEVRLSENALGGAFWCLLTALHPSSRTAQAIQNQDEVLWPLAEKLRLVGMLRKEIGLDKGKHRRLELDDDGQEAGTEEGPRERETAPAAAAK